MIRNGIKGEFDIIINIALPIVESNMPACMNWLERIRAIIILKMIIRTRKDVNNADSDLDVCWEIWAKLNAHMGKD